MLTCVVAGGIWADRLKTAGKRDMDPYNRVLQTLVLSIPRFGQGSASGVLIAARYFWKFKIPKIFTKVASDQSSCHLQSPFINSIPNHDRTMNMIFLNKWPLLTVLFMVRPPPTAKASGRPAPRFGRAVVGFQSCDSSLRRFFRAVVQQRRGVGSEWCLLIT
jgi:hypothetical protein